jgi:hypothetical protein
MNSQEGAIIYRDSFCTLHDAQFAARRSNPPVLVVAWKVLASGRDQGTSNQSTNVIYYIRMSEVSLFKKKECCRQSLAEFVD